MGNCCYKNNAINKNSIALKFPDGDSYIRYCHYKKCFIKDDDINNWIYGLYKDSKWENWAIYNDQTEKIGNKHIKHGHCKGILAWNDKNISWLIHSVPEFPEYFDGNKISKINHSELIYGQSFQYIEIEYSDKMIYDILYQIYIMNAHIYLENNMPKNSFDKNEKINILNLSDEITHIAKSHKYNIDIYSQYIANEYKLNWKIETWIRFHKIMNESKNVVDISNIQFEDVKYSEKQDHSKWGVSDGDLYWIGDINRMTSQFTRGGGGLIIKDKDVAKALNSIILDNNGGGCISV